MNCSGCLLDNASRSAAGARLDVTWSGRLTAFPKREPALHRPVFLRQRRSVSIDLASLPAGCTTTHSPPEVFTSLMVNSVRARWTAVFGLSQQ
jgi:hypothetical protein